MEQLEGPEARHIGLDLREAGEKARVGHELRTHAMIGVLAGDRRREHDARLELADQAHELGPRLRRVDDTRVRQPEVHARRNAENLGGVARLGGAELGRAARAHLALCEVDDGGTPSLRRGFEQRAATRELDVIAVCGDGQNVHGRHGENIRP